MTSLSRFQIPIVAVVAILLWLAPVIDVLPAPGWHDQQRVFEIVIGVLCGLGLVPLARRHTHLPRLDPVVLAGLYSLLVLGVMSSLNATYPDWAFIEVALFALSFSIWCWMGMLTHAHGDRVGEGLVLVAILVVVPLVVWFISATLVAFVIEAPLNPRYLLHGFSNIRWAGQFQTLTLPLLALPLWWLHDPRWRRAVLALLVLWWLVTLAGGSRGTLVSVVSVMVAFAAAGGVARRWSCYQFLALSVATVLYFVIFYGLAGLRTLSQEGGWVLRTGSAGRFALWEHALEGVRTSPWLGQGPLHYATNLNLTAAHPHNAVLQIAYEWGLPAAILFVALVLWALVGVFRRIWPQNRNQDAGVALRVTLAGALLGAGCHAMVSGVIVMPYTRVWVVLIGGCLWGLLASRPAPAHRSHRVAALVVVALGCGWLSFVAARDYDQLGNFTLQPGSGSPMARFWLQGDFNGVNDPPLR